MLKFFYLIFLIIFLFSCTKHKQPDSLTYSTKIQIEDRTYDLILNINDKNQIIHGNFYSGYVFIIENISINKSTNYFTCKIGEWGNQKVCNFKITITNFKSLKEKDAKIEINYGETQKNLNVVLKPIL